MRIRSWLLLARQRLPFVPRTRLASALRRSDDARREQRITSEALDECIAARVEESDRALVERDEARERCATVEFRLRIVTGLAMVLAAVSMILCGLTLYLAALLDE